MSVDPTAVVERATHSRYLQQRPRPQELQVALLALEKKFRRERAWQTAASLAGNWRLQFITGSARSRGGFYIPDWLQVEIQYAFDGNGSTGRVENSVACGPLYLRVTGPLQFRSPRNILAFDFTQFQVGAFGRQFLRGPLRGGPEGDERFTSTPVARQAFFTYFLISPRAIAARGRGGGLALWERRA